MRGHSGTRHLKLHYRTVFISDAHLGSRGAQARDLVRFLRCIECETLYLVGDIVDLWRMKSRAYWPVEHNEVIQHVLKLVEDGTDVRFIPGNHDEAAREYCGLEFGGVRLMATDIHETYDGRRFLVTHGDQFDLVVTQSPTLARLGSFSYEVLIVLNRWFNVARRSLGFSYWSLAQFLKLKVKSACMYVSRFEDAVMNEARRRNLDGVICGHIHKAEQRREGDGRIYLNCGDWIESCTAVVEHLNGRLEVIEALPAIANMVKRRGETVSQAERNAGMMEF